MLALVLLFVGPSTCYSEVAPGDWPTVRGPQQNRVSTATNLPEKWDPAGGEGSNLLWKRDDLGSRSTPVVFDGKLYTLVRDKPGTKDEGEKVVCVNAATGEPIWEHPFSVYAADVPDTRVAWSSCVVDPETGRVYAMGVGNYFCCLEGDSGKVVWDRSLQEEFGFLNTFGGRTNLPLVFEDTVLVSAVIIGWGDTPEFGSLAKPAHRFVCFDKATGEVRWLNGTGISPYDTTYSTPTIAVVDGVQQLVFGSGDGGVWALQPRTGVRLWNYPFSRRGLDATPLVDGNTVYMSQNQENTVGTAMGAVVALDATLRGDLTGKELWKQYQIQAGKCSPVLIEDQLWVIDDGAKLQAFDPKTGKKIGPRKSLGRVQRSSPLVADGKVYMCTNGGRWYVLKPDGKRVKVIDKVQLPGAASNDGSPIVAQGRIYLPTSDALYCIGTEESSGEEASYGEAPETAQEKPIEDSTPAVVQVIPYDALLSPGAGLNYQVRLYNAAGQFLQEATEGAKPEFSVSGSGSIDSQGKYVSAKDAAHEAALVTCKVGAVEGTARVRVVPPLPWTFDFESGDNMPISWVGGRVRYVPKKIDGESVAFKRTVLPTPRDPNNKLGTRSDMWMGPSDLSNYTIAADVRFEEVNNHIGDFGVYNCGYTLTVRSSNDKLRLYSWSPHDHRSFAEVNFEPKPDVWYRMKLKVVADEETAIVQGKIWHRDEEEPAEWTVEMTDERPIRAGSPGLYGNAQEAPFYVDNLSVTPNE
ncbi:outer membrane biogenesis protein BamB [Adhaeretor mobilis]|uniref:Outer membrane biogenesis protein BamB n=2 Tax=Adhaeretor mobilis TaxID=1930276 RepID=A0A517MQJ1_9BACT|nr:outer membrane biogenesis protein BamB [Adhaeretor mobilis]